METELSLKELQKSYHGSFQSYLFGFLTCFMLTSTAFLLVSTGAFSSTTLAMTVSVLAIVQASTQLFYFLHLGKEGRPYWETLVFFFMLLILLIIVLGSLWIMSDLNYRMMDIKVE